MKKTFKVGEYGYSDKYTVSITRQEIMLQGTGRNEFKTIVTDLDALQARLFDEVSVFYADKIMTWARSQ